MVGLMHPRLQEPSALNSSAPCSLITAAFRGGFTPATKAWLIADLVSTFADTSVVPASLDGLFVPQSNQSSKRSSTHLTVVGVSELTDGSGLVFQWAASTGATVTSVTAEWADLQALPVPDGADQLVAHLVKERAKQLWAAVLAQFSDQIRNGEVQLQGCRGSPLEEAKALPMAAAPYVRIVDWGAGTIAVAGERLFNVQVIPNVDPEEAYLQSIRFFAQQQGKIAEHIIAHEYPDGVPLREAVPDHVVLNRLSAEIKRLQQEKGIAFTIPSDSTLLRRTKRKT